MTEAPKSAAPALWAMRVASLWLLAGALFKLFAGTPADLPPNLVELVGKARLDLFFHTAIAIELAVVALTWLKPRLGWVLLAGTYAVFIAVLYPLVREGAESCGCMGSTIKIKPIVMTSIDGTLLLAILATRPWRVPAKAGGPTAIAALTVVVCAALPWVFIDSGSTDVPTPAENGTNPVVEQPRFVVLDFDTWVGRSIYDADFPLRAILDGDVDTLHPDGTWIFWRITCGHCADHLLELAGSYDGSPLVLIRDHEEGEEKLEPAVTLMPEGDLVQHVSLRKGTAHVMTTPVELIVEGGVVVSAEENVGADEH